MSEGIHATAVQWPCAGDGWAFSDPTVGNHRLQVPAQVQLPGPRYRHLPPFKSSRSRNTEADHVTRPGSCDSEADGEVEGRGQVDHGAGGLHVGCPSRRFRRLFGALRWALAAASEPSFASRRECWAAVTHCPCLGSSRLSTMTPLSWTTGVRSLWIM